MRWRGRWSTWPRSQAAGWKPFARAPRKNGPAIGCGSPCPRAAAQRTAAVPGRSSEGPSWRAACWAIRPTRTTWRCRCSSGAPSVARGGLGNPADAYPRGMPVPVGAATLVTAGAARAGIGLKRTTHRSRTVYYLKGAEPISRLLGLMGANRAVMRFENDRILRDMRSQANRRANSETANMDKRLRAALQQREAIRRLKARDNRLQSLPPALREVAELRLAHPRAGLRELAELAQVSKSAVANRLRRLVVQANRNGLID